MLELKKDDYPHMRSKMQRKFAKATPATIRRMEQDYEAGLPSKPGAVVFPPGIDIETKIEELEDRKRTLWFLCPESIREGYHYFYCALIVANRGTTLQDISRVAYTPRISANSNNYYSTLLPMLEIIVSVLDEIKWENRY